ncbi:MAG: hypothetical protein EHM79_15270 [Geobacter sp.]|nr:MAG: hypothetical protein EHM79_15270 [Geobacter sp.]
MPRGDKTGPRGQGQMTGRGAGYCAGSGMPGYANPVPGQGFGMGFGGGRGFAGGGRGWRNCFNATGLPGWMRFGGSGFGGYAAQNPAMEPNPEIAKQALKAQVAALEAELDFIKKRLSGMTRGVEEDE